MPERTAAWPGLPGPSRKGGPTDTPKHGALGEFYVYQRFSPPKLGTGARFKALEKEVGSEPSVRDPAAVAAAIGRKKYGAQKMARMSAAGRKK